MFLKLIIFTLVEHELEAFVQQEMHRKRRTIFKTHNDIEVMSLDDVFDDQKCIIILKSILGLHKAFFLIEITKIMAFTIGKRWNF